MVTLNKGSMVISGIEAIDTNTGDIVAYVARSGMSFIVNEKTDKGYEEVYRAYCLYLVRKYLSENYIGMEFEPRISDTNGKTTLVSLKEGGHAALLT